MRIAMVSTLTRPVPPRGEGSVELLVSHLTERLVAKGHDVTLFALADSTTSARLVSPVATSYVTDPQKWDWQLYEAFQVREAFRQWSKFDVINCHSYHFGLLFADFVPIPAIHSFHIEPGPDYEFLVRQTGRLHLHFCSRYQARNFLDLPDVHVIPHGIDLSSCFVTVPERREDYLAWLGRFHPDKGVLAALSIARKAGLPLKLAGPSNDYLRDVVLPQAEPGQVEYVGELRGFDKADFLSRARALVYPVERGEPFGLVLIEALACGLPVVAFNNGAVPEVVEHGVNGWIGETEEELIEGIQHSSSFDRTAIRTGAEERFSSDRMADQMEALMLSVTGLSAPSLAGKTA